ncbi:hypothetical protein P43SY_009184 [Pythium insidiosum]|uniref:Uncharacterized protein n=1 Tax=Pythium insidiosum TaxID=114742 RepID=A0AAD5M7Z6_PYTIN|nr:hypothetical protein P43SY_009184 [Pythium insidiosum]
MRLNVHVHGLQFVVPCGEGAQSVKWLGLAVAQRYALAQPHGRCRTREDAHLKRGFYLPAAVTKTATGQLLPPMMKINEVCKDNDTLTVALEQEVPVNEIGAPQLSPWTVCAFSCQPKVAAAVAESLGFTAAPSVAVAAASAASAPSAKADAKSAGLAHTPAAKGEQKEAKADAKGSAVDADIREYARSELLVQVNAGQLQSEMEVEAAFLYDWARLRVEDLEKDARERDAMQELLLAQFRVVHAAYTHYAVGSAETAYGMNGHELAHFLHECDLFHAQQDRAAVETLLGQCLRHDAFVSLVDRGTLSRVGFFHALLRAALSSARNKGSGTTREVVEKAFKDLIAPAVTRLTTGPFRDHIHQDRVVAVLQEAKPKLLKLYTRYTQELDERAPSRRDSSQPSASWPQLLTASGLKSLLYDCGVFCAGDSAVHDDVLSKALDQAFSGAKDFRVRDEQTVVFAEFMEIVCRVGLCMLKENDLPPRDAIKITLDAVRTLPVKATAQRK